MTQVDLIASRADRLPYGRQERRARRLFDEMHGTSAVKPSTTFKVMYPAALAAVPKGAETSLTNHIRNDINWRMRALLLAMIAMHRQREEERTGEPEWSRRRPYRTVFPVRHEGQLEPSDALLGLVAPEAFPGR